MKIMPDLVKELRQKTGAGIMDCKRALENSDGDKDEAVNLLRKQGAIKAAKKVSRQTLEGLIASYIHLGGKIGVLVEVNCETDFVAKTEDFKQLVKDITMHIAASDPRYISREKIGKEVIEQEKEIARSEFADKPAQVVEKIANGKLEKFYAENCLLDQPFVKDEDVTIREHIASCVARLGENVCIRRFTRFQLGEDIPE